jgi:hypothetical protein
MAANDTGSLDNSNGTPVGTVDTSGGSGGGGSNPFGFLSGITSGAGNLMSGLGNALGLTDPSSQAMMIPAIGMAINSYNNADKYQQLAQQSSQMANPFGQYRNQFGQELSNLEKDPSQIANTPGYKFALNQALDATQSRLASQGASGSSQMQNALAQEASGLAQQTYNSTIGQLTNLSGAQFSPDAAANLLMSGMTNSMLQKSNALGALFAPFGNQAGMNQLGALIAALHGQANNGGQGGTSGGSGGGGFSLSDINSLLGGNGGNTNTTGFNNGFNWNDPSTWGNSGDLTSIFGNNGTDPGGINWSSVGGNNSDPFGLSGSGTNYLDSLGLGGIGTP